MALFIGEVGAIRICGTILIDFILLLVNNLYKTSNQNKRGVFPKKLLQRFFPLSGTNYLERTTFVWVG